MIGPSLDCRNPRRFIVIVIIVAGAAAVVVVVVAVAVADGDVGVLHHPLQCHHYFITTVLYVCLYSVHKLN